MLTDGRFWIGAVVGVVGYHAFMVYRAKKSNS